MLYDLHTFLISLLDRNDRMTMGASIECRVPFLDHHLAEQSFRLPDSKLFLNGCGKGPLRISTEGILPDEIRWRPKWGFGVPWADYLRSKTDCQEFLVGLCKSNVNDVLKIPSLRYLIADFLKAVTMCKPLDWKRTVGKLIRQGFVGFEGCYFFFKPILSVKHQHFSFCSDACSFC